MSALTDADLQLGGRLQLACDALLANKLRTAAGIFNEIGGDLNSTAETQSGLLAPDDADDWSVELPKKFNPYDTPENKAMCARGVHGWGPIYIENGSPRSVCLCCGLVNVAPKDPENPGGPIAMSFGP